MTNINKLHIEGREQTQLLQALTQVFLRKEEVSVEITASPIPKSELPCPPLPPSPSAASLFSVAQAALPDALV